MLVGASGFGNGVSLVVAFFVNVAAKVFVVDFVAVFAFNGLASCFGEFNLSLALNLDGFVCCLEGCEKVGFGNFVHFAFDHHDVVVCGTDHELHVGFFELLESGVDYELSTYAGYAYFRDGSVEGDVADR